MSSSRTIELWSARYEYSIINFATYWIGHAIECAVAAYVFYFSDAPWIGSDGISEDARRVIAYRRIYACSFAYFVIANFQFLLTVAFVHIPSLTWLRNVSIFHLATSTPIRRYQLSQKKLRIPIVVYRLVFLIILAVDARYLKGFPDLEPVRAYAIYQCVAALCVAGLVLACVCGLRCILAIVMACCQTQAINFIERLLAKLEPRPSAVSEEQIQVIAPSFELLSEPVTDVATKTSTRDDCAVCLEPQLSGQLMRKLPACGHTFHAACIDNWFQIKTNCPLCRQELFSGSILAEGLSDICLWLIRLSSPIKTVPFSGLSKMRPFTQATEESLPVEIWESIAMHLSYRDLVSLSKVNRRFHWILNVACPRVWWFKRPDGGYWPRMRKRDVAGFEDRRTNASKREVLKLLNEHAIHLPNRNRFVDC